MTVKFELIIETPESEKGRSLYREQAVCIWGRQRPSWLKANSLATLAHNGQNVTVVVKSEGSSAGKLVLSSNTARRLGLNGDTGALVEISFSEPTKEDVIEWASSTSDPTKKMISELWAETRHSDRGLHEKTEALSRTASEILDRAQEARDEAQNSHKLSKMNNISSGLFGIFALIYGSFVDPQLVTDLLGYELPPFAIVALLVGVFFLFWVATRMVGWALGSSHDPGRRLGTTVQTKPERIEPGLQPPQSA